MCPAVFVILSVSALIFSVHILFIEFMQKIKSHINHILQSLAEFLLGG